MLPEPEPDATGEGMAAARSRQFNASYPQQAAAEPRYAFARHMV
jgi:hypothetical protein